MQDYIGRREHPLGAHKAGGGAKESKQFGRAPALILVGQQPRLAKRVPVLPWLGNGLIGPRFILVPQLHPGGFRLLVRLLDQPFFSGAAGSCTVTVPALRLRSAVPVGHQVRVLPNA